MQSPLSFTVTLPVFSTTYLLSIHMLVFSSLIYSRNTGRSVECYSTNITEKCQKKSSLNKISLFNTVCPFQQVLFLYTARPPGNRFELEPDHVRKQDFFAYETKVLKNQEG